MCKLLAPFAPFLTDKIYQNLTGEESVHLVDWPEADRSRIDEKLEEEMNVVRKVCEMGHAKRKELGLKVRQPLQKFSIFNFSTFAKASADRQFSIKDEGLINLIKDELNVKKVGFKIGRGKLKVDLDTKITPELKKEGEAREIVRLIQEERKKIGTKPNEKVDAVLNSWPKDMESYIRDRGLVRNIKKGSFEVLRIND